MSTLQEPTLDLALKAYPNELTPDNDPDEGGGDLPLR